MKIQSQLLRFLVVGGGFSLGYSVVVAVLIGPVGLRPYPTSIATFAVCVPLAFWVHKRFSYRASSANKSGFAIYTSSQIFSFIVVSSITTRFVAEQIVVDIAINLLAVGATAVLTFIILKLFVFSK